MKISLKTGQQFNWDNFGALTESYWEVVFNTWVTWYELTLTDPSYKDQIIVFTQPLIWNYWIPWGERDEYWILKNFESEKIWAKWVIVSEYSKDYSHWRAVESLWDWLKKQNIPWITWVDTRALTKILRNQWSTLWAILNDETNLSKTIKDPNERNLAWECSTGKVQEYEPKNPIWKTILLYDFWVKNNIIREFLKRGVKVIRAPFDAKAKDFKFDWLFMSNGPWDPNKTAKFVTDSIEYTMHENIPIFWICLWNQILWLAAWAKIEKMPYWHRWINQPCINLETWSCYITSQNHWFAIVEKGLPKDWETWWKNANDQTIEWIKHKSKNFRSVQFHPESAPWPEDTCFLFDEFVASI